MNEQFTLSLLMSGALGYLNYNMLCNLQKISYDESKEDKIAVWALYSFF